MLAKLSVFISICLAISISARAADELAKTEGALSTVAQPEAGKALRASDDLTTLEAPPAETYKIDTEFLVDELRSKDGFAFYKLKMTTGSLSQVGAVEIRSFSLQREYLSAESENVRQSFEAEGIQKAEIVASEDEPTKLALKLKLQQTDLKVDSNKSPEVVEMSIDIAKARVSIRIQTPSHPDGIWVSAKIDPPKKGGGLFSFIRKCVDVLATSNEPVDTPQDSQ